MIQQPPKYWGIPQPDLLVQLNAKKEGLSNTEARERLIEYGPNLLKPPKRSDTLALLFAQFKSPIILTLIFAAGLSAYLHDPVDAIIIIAIVLISSLLGFWQERGAVNALEKMLAIVKIKTTVLRDGTEQDIALEEVVPGDIVLLNAGDAIPADSLILESTDLFVDEATLTGETFPVEKNVGLLPPETPLAKRTNSLFMGTHVISGTATALAIFTGKQAEFGKISEKLKLRPQETEFEHGIRRFGYLLLEVTLLLVIAVFAINVFFHRPVLESFLFSLALAVGLTPQLLPAIISINLAHGARKMAAQKVIVKRLASIENFGSMDVLCSDKTGTLTEGTVRLHSAIDINGTPSDRVFLHAYLNSFYEKGFSNPIDEAIRSYKKQDVMGYEKVDEVPYDFLRKRLSILIKKDGRHLMVTKGALSNVLAVCPFAENNLGDKIDTSTVTQMVQQKFGDLSSQGFRVLGVAMRDMGTESVINKDSERDMTFLGFLLFFDPPKKGVLETIEHLKQLGVTLKVITGDNRLVATKISQDVGMLGARIITGPELHEINDSALLQKVNQTDIFAEVEPNQKERIILALRKAGHVVGYIGDGINDVSALHASDVSISVDTAVDVAKESADIVLLEKNLEVLVQGVHLGRTTLANTMKYVFMATSANFGNMFSMAGASLFLSFLPLLPKQILLTNLMTDFPEMTIATDRTDAEMVNQPKRWNISFIKKFMLTFGLISSVFDYLTFGVLLFILRASPDQFRTGWFVESVISASIIVLVIRSRRPFFRSRPGKYLLIATMAIVFAALIFPFTPLAKIFGFVPLPVSFLMILGIIIVLYILTAELAKKIFYQKINY
ncbi:MAG: magnesium-translocating P-type ATPase [Deltaproteobacteria bacterium HGW-Deltaproteobacteria-12]|jgi:Mg2+-importing ATPase|nr:MAG: magnesium-translocating P-type ATPase [Deltaproteobacteria bacterium HGW-Deltaproteobacteria-12]